GRPRARAARRRVRRGAGAARWGDGGRAGGAHGLRGYRRPARDLRAGETRGVDLVRAVSGAGQSRGSVPPADHRARRGGRRMSAIRIIARREVKSLFDLPTAYILLVIFIGVNDFLYFRQAEVYGLATLRPMLDLLPWLLLFFVPAVTMRALAEDVRAGTLEVVLAQPITERELLLGKHLGQVA